MTLDAMVEAGRITLIDASKAVLVGEGYDLEAAGHQSAVIIDVQWDGTGWRGNIGEFNIIGISDDERFTLNRFRGGVRFEDGHPCADARVAPATVQEKEGVLTLTRCGARTRMVPFVGSWERVRRWWDDKLTAIPSEGSHDFQLVQVDCHLDQLAALCLGPMGQPRLIRRRGGSWRTEMFTGELGGMCVNRQPSGVFPDE